MPDIIKIIERWWKAIAIVTIITTSIVAVILFSQERQYLAVTTALPANSSTFDKARIFNENIQYLYSNVGGGDEIDRFLGTAALDTLYKALVKEFGLVSYYKIEGENIEKKAIKKLKSNIKVVRSPYNELQVKAWDKNPQLASNLANSFFDKLQRMHQALQNQTNALVLKNLMANFEQAEKAHEALDDSANASPALVNIKKQALQQQLLSLQKIIGEYQVALSINPPVLLSVEKATISEKPDRPKRLQIMMLVFFGALVFGLLTAIFLESRKQHG